MSLYDNLPVPTCSVFDAMNIPYPKRKVLSDDNDKDDKAGDKVLYLLLL